jgi:hypothetical protein
MTSGATRQRLRQMHAKIQQKKASVEAQISQLRHAAATIGS